jgi:hypothetical protein
MTDSSLGDVLSGRTVSSPGLAVRSLWCPFTVLSSSLTHPINPFEPKMPDLPPTCRPFGSFASALELSSISTSSPCAYSARAEVDTDPLERDGVCHFPSSPFCIAGRALGANRIFRFVCPAPKSGVGGRRRFSSGSLVKLRLGAPSTAPPPPPPVVVGRDRFSPITERNLERAVWSPPWGDLARVKSPLMVLPMVGVGARDEEAKEEDGMMGL